MDFSANEDELFVTKRIAKESSSTVRAVLAWTARAGSLKAGYGPALG